MKSLSSAIVVLAGIYGICSSMSLLMMKSHILPLLGVVAGIITLALGLVGWWACLKFDR
jgi:hypothetical protein